jgi:hypothetical protein
MSGGPGEQIFASKLVSCIFLFFLSPFGCWLLAVFVVGCCLFGYHVSIVICLLKIAGCCCRLSFLVPGCRTSVTGC